MLDQAENRAMENFFSQYMRINSKAYVTVLLTILLFEACLIVRGFFVFDFSYIRHQLYFVSYILLIVISFAALILVLRNRDGRVSSNTITIALHLYCTLIIAWSLLVTILDMMGGHSPLVYLTVIMAIGGLSVVHPAYYAVNLLFSLVFLLMFRNVGNSPFFSGAPGGIYINLFVFVMVSLLLTVRHYRISRRELELTRYLEELSFVDQLTGISNRRSFDEAQKRLDAEDAEIMVGILDLDNFKGVNDTYGHDFGDACLIELGARLREFFGEDCFRFGGDEFAILCPPEPKEALAGKIEAINRALEAAFPGKQIAISIGFALHEKGSGVEMNTTEIAADDALYWAKAHGKALCCFADEASAEPVQKTAVVYLHGQGGSAAEAEHYRPLFPGCDVIGLDYKSQTPWEAGAEIHNFFNQLQKGYDRILLVANSIGAYYALQADVEHAVAHAFFISPVVDMERIIRQMMAQAGVTEAELESRRSIRTDSGELLSYDWLVYVRSHPIRWTVSTDILCGGSDTLSPPEAQRRFAEQHSARMTVMPGGEHWFHTEEQMRFLDRWITEKSAVTCGGKSDD